MLLCFRIGSVGWPMRLWWPRPRNAAVVHSVKYVQVPRIPELFRYFSLSELCGIRPQSSGRAPEISDKRIYIMHINIIVELLLFALCTVYSASINDWIRQAVPNIYNAYRKKNAFVSHNKRYDFCNLLWLPLVLAIAFQFGQKMFRFDSIRFSLPNRFFRFDSIRQSDKFAACTLIFK